MDKKVNRLSHSSVTRFQVCPRSWQYHYQEKLRPVNQSAALLFGSAVDGAITVLLNNFKNNAEEKNPEQVFGYLWRFQEVNGVKTYLPTCPVVVYSNSDFDKDLLTVEDWQKLEEKYQTSDDDIKELYQKKEHVGFDGLSQEEKTVLNFANWMCLYRKGLLMLHAVKTKILPMIEEVLAVQAYVKLENNVGDSVVGFADLVCRLKDTRIAVLDFKTATRMYDQDAVLTSPQLTLYLHALSPMYDNTRWAGYIVLGKRVLKNKVKICTDCGFNGTGTRFKSCNNLIDDIRCDGPWNETIDPEIDVQILIDQIPERTEDVIIENIDHINQCIKNGIFSRNLNSCIQNWGKCSFYDLCWKDSDVGLCKAVSKVDKDKGSSV